MHRPLKAKPRQSDPHLLTHKGPSGPFFMGARRVPDNGAMSLDPMLALQANQRPVPDAHAPVGHWRRAGVLLLGGGGTLGAAVLQRLLGAGGFAQVNVRVTQPLAARPRGLHDCVLPDGGDWADLRTSAAVAVMVFDVAKAREGAMWMPQPDDVLPAARRLKALGVRCLVLVMPHAPHRLPAALREGLWGMDEQALATMGFEHLVLLRPAAGASGSAGPARTPGWQGWGERLAGWMLSNLRFMVPTRQLPVRPDSIAALVVALVHALEKQTPAEGAGASRTWVVPAETVWAAAQPEGLHRTVQALVQFNSGGCDAA